MSGEFWDQISSRISEASGRSFCGEPAGAPTGGCVNAAIKLRDRRTGEAYFVKRNRADLSAMFEAEADGLAALAATAAIRAPKPVCWGQAAGQAFLAIEWLDLDGRGDWRRMGEALAAMHRSTEIRSFGWGRDNYIGATPQPNGWQDDWAAFFAERRLGFQIRLAERNGERFQRVDRLIARLPEIIGDDVEPSLLHGDLWSGNAAFSDGRPAVFDPAVYVGDREADLAMTELFGGFPPAFYAAYRQAAPLRPGYRRRRELYNLYHVLNHYNLFGGHYGRQAADIIERLAD